MFEMDTGEKLPEVMPTVWGMDEGQCIVITTHTRARTIYNKIKANIELQECPDALAQYWTREELMLDAMHLFDPHAAEALADLYETHLSCLEHGGAARPALPDTPPSPTAHNGNSGKFGDETNECIW